MTTIAADARAGVMASDSAWIDETQTGLVRKVFRVRGTLIGCAGTLKQIREWVAAHRKAEVIDPPEGIDDVTVLRLSSKGLDAWTVADGWCKLVERRFAIGTGGIAARAALEAGADVRDAVRIAIRIGVGSGGPVRQYRLKG